MGGGLARCFMACVGGTEKKMPGSRHYVEVGVNSINNIKQDMCREEVDLLPVLLKDRQGPAKFRPAD